MGGLGTGHLQIVVRPEALAAWRRRARLEPGPRLPRQPVCRLAISEQESGFFALGSGPARALARVEPLYTDLGYVDQHQGIARHRRRQGRRRPSSPARSPPAAACRPPTSPSSTRRPGASPARCRSSPACSRSRCTRRMPWASRSSTSSTASAPRRSRRRIPDFVQAMGRTNDAIIYGGRVHLFVRGADDAGAEARRGAAEHDLARLRPAVRRDLPAAGGDFYNIDPHAVQPGRGDRLRPRQRPHLPCGRTCSRRRRQKLPLSRDRPAAAHRALPRGGQRRLARAPARRGAARARRRRVVSSLPRCAFDTQLAAASTFPASTASCRTRCSCARSRGTLRADDLAPRRPARPARAACAVWNDARAIERCVDKSTTTFLLHKAGIPTPRTRTMETKPPADAYVARRRTGRWSSSRCSARRAKACCASTASAELPAPRRPTTSTTCRISCRRRAPSFEDWRVLVTRRRAVAAMMRRGRQLDHQRAPGGAPERRTSRARRWRSWLRGALRRRRRRLRRRRSHPHAGRAAARARGQQHPVLARAAERRRHRHRRGDGRGLPARRRRARRREPQRPARMSRPERGADRRSVPRRLPRRARRARNRATSTSTPAATACRSTQFEASAEAAAPFLAAAGGRSARASCAPSRPRSRPSAATPISASCCCARRSPRRPSCRAMAVCASGLRERARQSRRCGCRRGVRRHPPGQPRRPRHGRRAGRRDAPTVGLLEAMRLAADRDRIAAAYVTDYADIFEFGLPVLANARGAYGRSEPRRHHAAHGLPRVFPDSHIVASTVLATAEAVREEAHALVRLLATRGAAATHWPNCSISMQSSKRRNVNPGTTADLVVATVFVASMCDAMGPRAPLSPLSRRVRCVI